MKLDVCLNSIEKKDGVVPKWAGLIKRWNQLDGEAFAVAQASYDNREFIGKPSLIVFTSMEGSAPTDCDFVNSSKVSPAFFVHTLPNVRAMSLSLIIEQESRVLCLSRGEKSLISCIDQFYKLSQNQQDVLLVATKKVDHNYECDFYKLNGSTGRHDWSISTDGIGNKVGNDFEFRTQILKNSAISITLPAQLTIRPIY